MALTTTQVNQAFLATLGRPAEGSAVTWASGSFADLASLVSSIIDIRKGGDFENNKETFVENLYQNLLGRASDAEGKEFWLKALNDGASYAQVAQGFINAVLGQSQTEDLYKLQNKLDVAEKISAQINTFQGGAAAEATLKSLMKDVNANTTIDSIQDSVDNFVGNSVNIKTVTINPADTDPAEIQGSADNATVFNLSLDVASENSSMTQTLTGSTKFADTLNVKVTSSDKEAASTLNNIGTISNIKTLNITTDGTIESTGITIPNGVKNLSFTGKSNDTVNVTAAMTSLNTGGGNDAITLGAKVNSVNAGAGNDNITVSVAKVAMKIDGGTGVNSVNFNTGGGSAKTDDFSTITLTNINAISGKGTLNKASLDGKELTISGDFVVKAAAGIDLSKSSAVEAQNNATLDITGVKSGTVSLTQTTASTLVKEKVILDAGANKVTITNFAGTKDANSDKIDFTSALGGANDFTGIGNANTTLTAAPAAGTGLTTKKAYILDIANNDTIKSVDGTISAANATTVFGKFAAQGANNAAVVFVTNTNDSAQKTGIYLVSGPAGNVDTFSSVKLLATIDQDVAVGDTFKASTFGGN